MSLWPKWYRPQTGYVDIVGNVARFYGITPEDLRGPVRNNRMVEARWVACKALRDHKRLSYPAIGRVLGKDHSSIIHAVNSFEKRSQHWPRMKEALAASVLAA